MNCGVCGRQSAPRLGANKSTVHETGLPEEARGDEAGEPVGELGADLASGM